MSKSDLRSREHTPLPPGLLPEFCRIRPFCYRGFWVYSHKVTDIFAVGTQFMCQVSALLEPLHAFKETGNAPLTVATWSSKGLFFMVFLFVWSSTEHNIHRQFGCKKTFEKRYQFSLEYVVFNINFNVSFVPLQILVGVHMCYIKFFCEVA